MGRVRKLKSTRFGLFSNITAGVLAKANAASSAINQ